MDFSTLKIDGLSKQDEALVKSSPNASIEELMQAGLTSKGENILRKMQGSIKPFRSPLQPKTVQHNYSQPVRAAEGQVVYNKRTGRNVRMSNKAANRILGKLNPNREMGKNYGQNYSKG